MSSPGTLRFGQVNSKPSPPPLNYDLIYVKTDDVLYIQDSSGVEVALGSSSSITQLTGDVSATGPGIATATVNSVGGQSAANIASAVTGYLAATSSDTPSTLVLRDASGNFSAGTITSNLIGNVTGNLTGNVMGGTITGLIHTVGFQRTVVSKTSAYTATINDGIIDVNATGGDVVITLPSASTANVYTIIKSDSSANTVTIVPSGGDTISGQSSIILYNQYDTYTVDGDGGTEYYIDAAIIAGLGPITQLTGDGTAIGPGSAVFTLATVNSNVGTFGSSTSIPTFTVNAKGLITAASGNVVVAPAGTLTGTTLASNVVSSSLTSVGTITSGIWNGTPIAINFGGTGQTTASAAFAALSPLTTAGDIIYENATPLPARLPIGTTGQILTVVGGLPAWANSATSGTVTSVALTVPSIFSVTGSPITTSGTLAVTLNSESANTFFAAPNGSAGTPTFRSIVNGDLTSITTLSSLNLPTSQLTGTISLTTQVSGILPIANGGTGQSTANAAFDALSPMTTAGDLIYENSTPTATRLPIGTTGQLLTVVAGEPAWVSPATSGTVTSVALTDGSTTPIYAITGSPVTSSGTLTFTLNTEPANTVFAGPISGGSAQPTFRSLVSADIPPINLATSGNGGVTGILPNSNTTGTSLNTPGTLVLRDGSGNFSASTITATLNGNASNITATTNSTLTTLTALSLPGSQVTGNISGNAANITATSNTTLTSLPNLTSAASLIISGAQVTGFTQGSVIFAGASGQLTQDNPNFYWNDSTLNLGLGVIPATNIALDIVNSSGTSKAIQTTSYGTGSSIPFRGRFARGTIGTPAAVQSGDNLSVLSGRGYGTSQFATASTGAINIVAGETFTNTSNATYLQFEATPTGSVTLAEHMRVAATGVTLGPQSLSTDIHQINGGVNLTTKTITASTYTVDTTTTDNIIYTDSTSNTITITLPTATNGRIIMIQDKTGEASTNHITVTPPGSITINGVNSSVLLGVNYGGWIFTSDGTNWTYYRLAQLPSVQPISASNIDWSTVGIGGGLFTKILSANTTFTFSNATPGQTIVIRLTNTASNYTVTWPSMKWPVQTSPVMTTGAFSDVYTIIYDGTNYFGSYVQNF